MKANKFFAVAMAALALVACKPGETGGSDNPGGNNGQDPDQPGQEVELALSETSKTIEVGEAFDLTATVAAEFAVNKEGFVALTPANDGKSVNVKGVAEGSVIITATTKGGQSKTCVVKVAKKEDPNQPAAALKGSQVWPIILDGDAYTANESKIVASFQPDDVDRFLYVWDQTYIAGDGEGINSLGNFGYTSLTVSTIGWSGMGYCVKAESVATAGKPFVDLLEAIKANPDQYALHFAIKSTDNQAHTIYFLGTDKTKFVLGTPFDGGVSIGDFKRDGAWHDFDIEMSDWASALANVDAPYTNYFVVLSGGTTGTQLNLDAVYFYKK